MMNKKYPFYFITRPILGTIFKLYYNPKIINNHYIPKEGSIVIAGNHKHLYDQNMVIISTKRMINYMAKKEYFEKKSIAWFFKWNGCISVNRRDKDEEAVNSALEVLTHNGAIGIFPEGTRNRTIEPLLDFKYGAVSLAYKTNSYIVPFAITGDYKFRSKNLTITFSEPFKVKDMNLDSTNEKLYNIVKELL